MHGINLETKDVPPNSVILFTFDMDSMTIDEVMSQFNTIKEQFPFHPVVSLPKGCNLTFLTKEELTGIKNNLEEFIERLD